MTTPLYARNFVKDIQSRGFKNLTEAEFIQLTTVTYSLLPQHCNNGKTCSNCSHRMPNGCKTCPDCWHRQVKKKPIVVEEKDEKDENACNGACDKDLSSERAIILPCGHKFCVACMKDRVDDNFITCCFCDSVRIPEYIRDELRNVDVVRE